MVLHNHEDRREVTCLVSDISGDSLIVIHNRFRHSKKKKKRILNKQLNNKVSKCISVLDRQLCASVRSLMLLPDLNPNLSIVTSQSLYITTSLPPNPHIPMK